jgi:hypothetical protein
MVSKSFPWLAGGVASEERIHPPLALAESAAELLAWGGIIGSCGDSYGFASGRVRRKQRRESEPFAKPLAFTLKAKGLFLVMVFSYPVVPFGWDYYNMVLSFAPESLAICRGRSRIFCLWAPDVLNS